MTNNSQLARVVGAGLALSAADIELVKEGLHGFAAARKKEVSASLLGVLLNRRQLSRAITRTDGTEDPLRRSVGEVPNPGERLPRRSESARIRTLFIGRDAARYSTGVNSG